MNMINKLLLMLVGLFLLPINVFAQSAVPVTSPLPTSSPTINQTTTLLGIEVKEGNLLIGISKNYPQVKYTFSRSEKKVLIELLDTKYHEAFVFDVPVKKNILDGLAFLEDVSIGEAKYGNDNYKIGIWLKYKEDIRDIPKVISKEASIVKIGFQEDKEIALPAPNKPQIDTSKSDVINKLLGEDFESIKKDIEVKAAGEPSTSTMLDNNIVVDDSKDKYVAMSVIELYNVATDEYSKGNLEKAEKLYLEVLEQDKNFFLAKFNLANIYLDQEKYEESAKLLKELSEKFDFFLKADQKNLLIVRNTLGIVYYSKGELEQALHQFQSIVKINPDVYEPYYNIGLIYEKLENVKEAKASFQKAIEMKPSFADAHYHLGILNLITKDKKQAAENFKKAIEIDPNGKIGKLSQGELEKIDKKNTN